MKMYTNHYQIAEDIMSSCEDEFYNIIESNTSFFQEEDETDEDYEQRVENAYSEICEISLRKLADIIHTQRGVD
jgi:hypothetical protein